MKNKFSENWDAANIANFAASRKCGGKLVVEGFFNFPPFEIGGLRKLRFRELCGVAKNRRERGRKGLSNARTPEEIIGV